MELIKKELGEKKYIAKLKDVFDDESKDFTPWLEKNLAMLSREIGIDIEIVDSNTEVNVGSFFCDIVARTSDDDTVVIENQFGDTNHDHLGKVQTYAANKGAKIIIWIAEKFRDEHRKTLQWLNDNFDTESGVSFFGVEISMIQIGSSPAAADFNVVVKPNDFLSKMKLNNKKSLGDTAKKYLDFFEKLSEEYSKKDPHWRKSKYRTPHSWLSFPSGYPYLGFAWSFKGNNKFSVELYIGTSDKDENERIFDALKGNEDQIKESLSEYEISWEKKEDKQHSRIVIYKDVDDSLIEWAIPAMKKFSHVMSEYIKKL